MALDSSHDPASQEECGNERTEADDDAQWGRRFHVEASEQGIDGEAHSVAEAQENRQENEQPPSGAHTVASQKDTRHRKCFISGSVSRLDDAMPAPDRPFPPSISVRFSTFHRMDEI